VKSYLRILRDQNHPLRFLLSRILMATGLSKRFLIDRPGYKLRFYPTPRTAELWIDLSAPRPEEPFTEAYLKPGDTVVDIGANIGELTLRFAGIVGSGGRVVAIEAHPRIFGYLEGNVAVNDVPNVQCFNYAVSNAGGTIRFSDNRWDELNSIVTSGGSVPTVEVPAIRLDDLPVKFERIDLLKIDVEGAEKFVLEGAGATLEKTACVYFESNEQHYRRNGYSCRELYAMFASRRFTVYRFVDGKGFTRIDGEYSSTSNENLIAVREPSLLGGRTGLAVRNS
jgi:FkbM family methyltransferase